MARIKLAHGYEMHYIDQGAQDGHPVFLLHGNPTWSYYYRNLVPVLVAAGMRVIVPDHIGCGLSDKPDRDAYDYRLDSRIKDMLELREHLQLTEQNYSLVLHDWGGAIGMGMATRLPAEKLSRVVLMNTAAFRSKEIPWRIFLGKVPRIGEFLIRGLNAFALAATVMTTTKPLLPQVKKKYLEPYDSYAHRIAVYEFVRDIPLYPEHRSYQTLQEIEDKLPLLNAPKLLLWGAKDFCFNLDFLKRWQEIYPQAKTHVYENASHYVLEDASPHIEQQIAQFLTGTAP